MPSFFAPRTSLYASFKRLKRFKFVFDFGDDWEFNCKVLRIVYEDTKDAELIRAVGEPPEQYPDYDDFEDDE